MPYRPPDEILQALVAERYAIQNVIASSVDVSFRMAHARLFTGVGEIEKLIYFFMEGLPLIEGGMNRLLGPHRVHVTVSGVFCHLTPKVKGMTPTVSPSSCELGDIAFLATYAEPIGPEGDGLGNGLLMQAKERFYPGVASVQENLYENVETFLYTSPNPLTGNQRYLGLATGCLYYWNFAGWSSVGAPPGSRASTQALLARPRTGLAPGLYHGGPFEQVLTDLFSGASGRGFQVAPAGNGWSQTVHDLVETAAERSIRHRRIFNRRRSAPPGRLYNYRSLIGPGPAPSFIRCSLDKFLGQFGKRFFQIGEKLVKESEEFSLPDQKEEGVPPGGGDQPPLTRGNDSDGGSGGGSFVVFQFHKA